MRRALRPGRGCERAAVVFVVAAAAGLRAHRPEHHADDEARDGRGGDRGNEGAARARPPQAPGRLDGFGVLDLDQFVIFGRRRACCWRLLHLHGFGFLPVKAAPRGPACSLCVSNTRRCRPQAGSVAARASQARSLTQTEGSVPFHLAANRATPYHRGMRYLPDTYTAVLASFHAQT